MVSFPSTFHRFSFKCKLFQEWDAQFPPCFPWSTLWSIHSPFGDTWSDLFRQTLGEWMGPKRHIFLMNFTFLYKAPSLFLFSSVYRSWGSNATNEYLEDIDGSGEHDGHGGCRKLTSMYFYSLGICVQSHQNDPTLLYSFVAFYLCPNMSPEQGIQ